MRQRIRCSGRILVLCSGVVILIVAGLAVVYATARSSPPAALPSALSPEGTARADCTNVANGTCVQTRTGLSLCRLNNVCVVEVDLSANTLVPRVAVAPGGDRDWLSSLATSAGGVAAINGDYFSGCPDPVPPYNCGEGLTFVEGVDYTDYTGNEWQNRRSLGFNSGYDPNVGWPGEQGGFQWHTLGGGPQVTFGGEYRWRCWYQDHNTEGDCWCQDNTVVINNELFGCSASNWWNRPQSYLGFSDDGNRLYLAVCEPGYTKTPHEMHDVLWVFGARHSLKLDGGGSSGMYFNDGGYSFVWNGSRQVANAWVIVPYSPPPTPTPEPTPPSGCDPSADQAALYADADYAGACVTLDVGDYPNPDYLAPVGGDNAESVRVGGNVQATLCEDDNYHGLCETFTSDDPNLGDNSIGANVVSSAQVQRGERRAYLPLVVR